MMLQRVGRFAGGLFGFRIGHGEAPSDGPYPAIAIAPNIGAAPPGRKGWAVSAGRSASRARSFAPAKENVLPRASWPPPCADFRRAARRDSRARTEIGRASCRERMCQYW